MLSAHLLRWGGGVVAAAMAALLPWSLTHLPSPGEPGGRATHPPAAASPAPTVTVTRTKTRTVIVHPSGHPPRHTPAPPAVVDYLHQAAHHPGTHRRHTGTGGHSGSHPSGRPHPPPRPSPPPHPSPSPTPQPTPTRTPPGRPGTCLDVQPVVKACVTLGLIKLTGG